MAVRIIESADIRIFRDALVMARHILDDVIAPFFESNGEDGTYVGTLKRERDTRTVKTYRKLFSYSYLYADLEDIQGIFLELSEVILPKLEGFKLETSNNMTLMTGNVNVDDLQTGWCDKTFSREYRDGINNYARVQIALVYTGNGCIRVDVNVELSTSTNNTKYHVLPSAY